MDTREGVERKGLQGERRRMADMNRVKGKTLETKEKRESED